jgi:hypothetical protein
MAEGHCKGCGAKTDWNDRDHYDEEDGWSGGYEEFCGYCYDVMAEREQKRREWAHYHPGEACPEIELPAMPARK